MSKDEKHKYAIWPSIRYMLSMASKHKKSVIFMCVLHAILQIGLNLAQLLVAPEILKCVETAAPLNELLCTIGLFTGLIFILTASSQYIHKSAAYSRIFIRTKIMHAVTSKSFMTSYQNCDDPIMSKLFGAVLPEVGSNQSPTEYIWTTITDLIVSLGALVLYLLIMRDISGIMIVITALTCILNFVSNQRVIQWQINHNQESGSFWRKYHYLQNTVESASNAKDIRIFRLEDWIRQLYTGVVDLHKAFVNKCEKKRILSQLINVILTFLRNGIAYSYLLGAAITTNMSASEFLLYFSAISGFTALVIGIMDQLIAIYRQAQGIGTVLEYLNYPEPFRFDGGIPLPDISRCKLCMEDVTFRYPGADRNIFENFNLTIRPGEKLAIVGLNGAGKTTLVKLLCGFYDPDSGRITLNGIDIREFNRREYYDLLCAVYQDFSVLDVTIAENIAQTVNDINEERVWECLECAGLDRYVRQLPNGLNTHVGRDVFLDGVLFSGGQTQRLMLARALYKGGAILVLDEPTAALDPIAEKDIYQMYNAMARGRTSLFISHRLASTRFCDRIILLSDGTIIEEGTHWELVEMGGAYARLYDVQSKYYQEGVDSNEENAGMESNL